MKKVFAWGGYCLVVAAFFLTCVESFVRVFILPKDFLYFHVERKSFPYFRLVDQFRDPAVTIVDARREPSPRTGRARKIAFIGDSQTFGVGASDGETYEELLQKQQTVWDTHNFGVPGYGLPEILRTAEKVVAGGKYDVVAYNYNFNDVLVAMSMFLPLLGDSSTRLRTIDDYEGKYGALKLFAKDHLKSLFIVKSVLFTAQAVEEAAKPPPAPGDATRGVAAATPLTPPYHLYERIYSDPRLRGEMKEYFRRLKEIVTASGARFVVFMHFEEPIMANDVEAPRRNMESLLRELDIEQFDTYSTYHAHFREPGFYADPGHTGALGNRYIATAIRKYLDANR